MLLRPPGQSLGPSRLWGTRDSVQSWKSLSEAGFVDLEKSSRSGLTGLWIPEIKAASSLLLWSS